MAITRDALIATATQQGQARELAGRLLEGAQPIELRDGSNVPPELAQLIRQVIAAVATGRTVTIGTLPEELTTSVAADMLGMSRPTLMKLVREGVLPAHKVGSHTRLRTVDVVAFRRRELEVQRKAFDELRELEPQLGLE